MASLLQLTRKSDAEPAAAPLWHPNFRNYDRLPDTKAVRTALLVNLVAGAAAVVAAAAYLLRPLWRRKGKDCGGRNGYRFFDPDMQAAVLAAHDRRASERFEFAGRQIWVVAEAELPALAGALAFVGIAEPETVVLHEAHRHLDGAVAGIGEHVRARDHFRQVVANRLAHLFVVAQPVARTARKQLVPAAESVARITRGERHHKRAPSQAHS